MLDHLCSLVGARRPIEICAKASKYLFGGLRASPRREAREVIDHAITDAMEKWGIALSDVSRLRGGGAKLFPVRNGFILRCRMGLRPTTKRFFKVHEIAHILFYDLNAEIPLRLFPFTPAEEIMCNKISRETLLPDLFVGGSLDKILSRYPQIDVRSIDTLARSLQVIPWQIIKRVLDRGEDAEYAALYWRCIGEGTAFQVIDVQSPYGIYLPLREKSQKDEHTHRGVWTAASTGHFFGPDEVELGSITKTLLVASFAVSDPWQSVIEVIELDEALRLRAKMWRESRGSLYPFHSH